MAMTNQIGALAELLVEIQSRMDQHHDSLMKIMEANTSVLQDLCGKCPSTSAATVSILAASSDERETPFANSTTSTEAPAAAQDVSLVVPAPDSDYSEREVDITTGAGYSSLCSASPRSAHVTAYEYSRLAISNLGTEVEPAATSLVPRSAATYVSCNGLVTTNDGKSPTASTLPSASSPPVAPPQDVNAAVLVVPSDHIEVMHPNCSTSGLHQVATILVSATAFSHVRCSTSASVPTLNAKLSIPPTQLVQVMPTKCSMNCCSGFTSMLTSSPLTWVSAEDLLRISINPVLSIGMDQLSFNTSAGDTHELFKVLSLCPCVLLVDVRQCSDQILSKSPWFVWFSDSMEWHVPCQTLTQLLFMVGPAQSQRPPWPPPVQAEVLSNGMLLRSAPWPIFNQGYARVQTAEVISLWMVWCWHNKEVFELKPPWPPPAWVCSFGARVAKGIVRQIAQGLILELSVFFLDVSFTIDSSEMTRLQLNGEHFRIPLLYIVASHLHTGSANDSQGNNMPESPWLLCFGKIEVIGGFLLEVSQLCREYVVLVQWKMTMLPPVQLKMAPRDANLQLLVCPLFFSSEAEQQSKLLLLPMFFIRNPQVLLIHSNLQPCALVLDDLSKEKLLQHLMVVYKKIRVEQFVDADRNYCYLGSVNNELQMHTCGEFVIVTGQIQNTDTKAQRMDMRLLCIYHMRKGATDSSIQEQTCYMFIVIHLSCTCKSSRDMLTPRPRPWPSFCCYQAKPGIDELSYIEMGTYSIYHKFLIAMKLLYFNLIVQQEEVVYGLIWRVLNTFDFCSIYSLALNCVCFSEIQQGVGIHWEKCQSKLHKDGMTVNLTTKRRMPDDGNNNSNESKVSHDLSVFCTCYGIFEFMRSRLVMFNSSDQFIFF